MDQWEIDLREQLYKEIPEGIYDMSCEGWVLFTGKQGKINEIVAFEKIARQIREGTSKTQENDI